MVFDAYDFRKVKNPGYSSIAMVSAAPKVSGFTEDFGCTIVRREEPWRTHTTAERTKLCRICDKVSYSLSQWTCHGFREHHTKSMQHGQGVRPANQARVKFEIEIEAAIRFAVVNGPRHQQVSRVMVAFRFHEAGVELRQRAVDWPEFAGENLKFFATAPFDERA